MSNQEPIREYDPNGNLIYFRNNNGYEIWYEYDTGGRFFIRPTGKSFHVGNKNLKYINT
jgi:hypothetical protein